jgi:bacillithiol system protein YtxJ
MNWIQLRSKEQLEEIKTQSLQKPVLIFKHSTRCSTSRMSLDRLERNWNKNQDPEVITYFVDLLNFREISNSIADMFKVEHESPQILLIYKGEAVLDQSHFEIDFESITTAIKNETRLAVLSRDQDSTPQGR